MFRHGYAQPGPYVLAAILLAVAGFAAPARAVEGAKPTPPASTASHLMVGDWVNGDDAMLALINGVLVTQPDGCVGIQVPGAPKPVLLNWPAGSKLSADATSIRGLSGKQFRIGDEVGLGGGFGGRAVPSECDASSWGSVFEVQQPV